MLLMLTVKGNISHGILSSTILYALQVKILSDEESKSEKTGSGELCIKSPSLFTEYWKLPEVCSEC